MDYIKTYFNKNAKPIVVLSIPEPPEPLDQDIEDLHTEAFNLGENSYYDPDTGFKVFTAYAHLKRGSCCGSKCRHCPYGWSNVNNSKKCNQTEEEVKEVGEGKTKSVPYTKTGDQGTSALFTGSRRSKDDGIFEALGTIDELNSTIGLAYSSVLKIQEVSIGKQNSDELVELIEQLQIIMSRLLDVGSYVATPESDNTSESKLKLTKFEESNVLQLEKWIDTITELLPELSYFILPTGSDCSARLHVARTVCRRAERRVISLSSDIKHNLIIRVYLNRLSDYLFSAARLILYIEGNKELRYYRQGENFQREISIV